VLELDDPPHLAVELDVHPVLEAVRVDRLGHAAGGYPGRYSLAQVVSPSARARALRIFWLPSSFLPIDSNVLTSPSSLAWSR
jgi:hypothetical protein